MSYDLMVFAPESAPRNRTDFWAWYSEQTKWGEGHSYNDPAVTTDGLRAWFMEMIETFPAMNGPFASDEEHDRVTDYCIGKQVIYVTFAWSVAEAAYEVMRPMAEKHQVGFFDVSANEGAIFFPDGNGRNISIDNQGDLSSIRQIQNSALPGQENMTVKDIIYERVMKQLSDGGNNGLIPQKKKSWWKRLFGI